MENATDALIMAGSVLLLIIALTVNISSFTNLKANVEEVLSARDEIDLVKDESSGKFINYVSSKDVQEIRTVNTDVIITELRRMRKEKNIIYIYGINATGTTVLNKLTTDLLFDQNLKDGSNTGVLAKNTQVIKFSLTDDKIIFYNDTPTGPKQGLNEVLIKEIYNKTKNETFKEYIGFYQEEINGVSDANMENARHKIITFVKN